MASKDGLTWVTAANTVEILDRGLFTADNFYGEELEYGIEVDMTHVGNTSFRGVFQIYRLNEDGSPKGRLTARVLSRAVCVNSEDLSPAPLPGAEALRDQCVPEPAMAAPTEIGERPADAFLWSTAARGTDCDGLGHLNNTKYAT